MSTLAVCKKMKTSFGLLVRIYKQMCYENK